VLITFTLKIKRCFSGIYGNSSSSGGSEHGSSMCSDMARDRRGVLDLAVLLVILLPAAAEFDCTAAQLCAWLFVACQPNLFGCFTTG
jgi:hypothetical protein